MYSMVYSINIIKINIIVITFIRIIILLLLCWKLWLFFISCQ